MKKKIQLTLLLLLSIGYVKAGYLDGNFLKEMSNAPITDNAHFQYVGYIAAVIDMDDETTICVDYGASMQPILDTTQKYLEEHPEELNKSAFVLIQSALKQEFPCKAKAKH